MLLRFSKMHGLGNDFVVIDLVTQRFNVQKKHIQYLADRHFGIGCDQVLVVEPPKNPDVDFRYRIFNADGNEVQQCGNGARCFARFVTDKKLTGKNPIQVETAGGVIQLTLTGDNCVEVNMGTPNFAPEAIPLDRQKADDQGQGIYELTLNDKSIEFGAVSMGNPHAVIRVDNVKKADVRGLGKKLTCHPIFPECANIGFMQVMSRADIKLRVFERGVGETLACGTGACAAVAHGIQQDWLDKEVSVELPGGKLQIEWQGGKQPVRMTGPATHVFDGKIHL